MKNSMIIVSGKYSEHHICPCQCCILDKSMPDKIIPTFYSHQEAERAGWRYTDNPKFCPPNEDYVWVCPGCSVMVREPEVYECER